MSHPDSSTVSKPLGTITVTYPGGGRLTGEQQSADEWVALLNGAEVGTVRRITDWVAQTSGQTSHFGHVRAALHWIAATHSKG